jgi:uroporphyrinogen decarboxylase
MNAKERVEAALRFEEPDRVPVWLFAGVAPYHITNTSFEEALFDKKLVAKTAIGWQEIFPNNDVIFCHAPGMWLAISEVLGGKAELLPSGWVNITKCGIKDIADLEKLDFNEITSNLMQHKAVTTDIGAIEIVSKKFGREHLISDLWYTGYSAAGKIVGTENLMLLLYDDPEFVEKFSSFMNSLCIEAFERLVNAGVNLAFVSDPIAQASLISPKMYREIPWGLEKKVAKTLKKLGCYSMLHICGNSTPILEEISETGCDMYSFDQLTDMGTIKGKIGNKTGLVGNVDPARMLLGTPEEIMNLSKECIKTAAPGGGYILAPGCDTAKKTPQKNYNALCEAAIKYGKYPINL